MVKRAKVDGKILVHVQWRRLLGSKDTLESVKQVYEDGTVLLMLLFQRKNSFIELVKEAHRQLQLWKRGVWRDFSLSLVGERFPDLIQDVGTLHCTLSLKIEKSKTHWLGSKPGSTVTVHKSTANSASAQLYRQLVPTNWNSSSSYNSFHHMWQIKFTSHTTPNSIMAGNSPLEKNDRAHLQRHLNSENVTVSSYSTIICNVLSQFFPMN